LLKREETGNIALMTRQTKSRDKLIANARTTVENLEHAVETYDDPEEVTYRAGLSKAEREAAEKEIAKCKKALGDARAKLFRLSSR